MRNRFAAVLFTSTLIANVASAQVREPVTAGERRAIVRALENKIAQTEIQRAEASLDYKDKSPVMHNFDLRLSAYRRRLAQLSPRPRYKRRSRRS